jgi:hypothetical protein
MNYQNNLWTELCFNTMNWLIEFQISIVWKCKLLVLFIKWTYLLKNCGVAFFDKEVKLYGWEKYTSLVSLSHGDVQYIYLYLHIYLYVKLTISFLAANPNIVWKMKWITCLHLVFEFRTRSDHILFCWRINFWVNYNL